MESGNGEERNKAGRIGHACLNSYLFGQEIGVNEGTVWLRLTWCIGLICLANRGLHVIDQPCLDVQNEAQIGTYGKLSEASQHYIMWMKHDTSSCE